MKSLLFILAAAILTLNAVEDLPVRYVNNYCAEIEDGLIAVSHDGTKLNTEVTLKNGTIIKPNGEVSKTDGTRFTLNAGECIDNDGNLLSTPPDNQK